MTLPDVDMTTFDLSAITDRLERLPRFGNKSTNSCDSSSLGELGDDELDSVAPTSVYGPPSPRSLDKSTGDGGIGATMWPLVNGDLETSNDSTSTVKPFNREDIGIALGEEEDSVSVVLAANAQSEIIATKDSRVVHCKEKGVEDLEAIHMLQDLVERNWEADRVANRGTYDTTRLSRKKRITNFIFTVGGQTLHLKRAVMNAILFGIALRILSDILIAVGVHMGWLHHTIQNSRISKESILEMQSALESHFRKPRTGQFSRDQFCQIVRVVTWVLGEIRDDLHALMSSSQARDDIRGHLYRVRFAKDWSLPFPPMLKGYDVMLNGVRKSSVIVKDPLKALSYAQLQARPPSGKRQKGDGNAMAKGAADGGLTTALANFWFGALHVHANLRNARKNNTVSNGQPTPYEVEQLQELPNKLRRKLRERCRDVNHALVGNIELLQAELRASLGEDAKQSLQQSAGRHNEWVDEEKSQTALTHLHSIQQGLQQDLRDIEALFIDGHAADRDVDVLLFYNGLRTHAWNNGWYGAVGEGIVEELSRRPGVVMRQAYNVSYTPRTEDSATE